MKIAHLSDFHLNSFFKNSNLDKINQLIKYAFDEGFDHMVITGDLTDNAEPGDFEILKGLFKSFGLLNPEKLSLIPGNHDIFGGLQTAEDILTFPERCKTTDYLSKVKEYENYFPEVFENSVYKGEESMFPFAKILDDVLFIGLNSIAKYSKIKNPFASNGEIELNQFYEIEHILKNFGPLVKTKLILVHHHFNKMTAAGDNSTLSLWQNIEKQTMKLRKKKRLLKLFNTHQVDLVLHGHIHENIEYERKGVKFLNAGGCIKGCTENSFNINFVDISPVKTDIVIHNIHLSGNNTILKNKDILPEIGITESDRKNYRIVPASPLMN
ncbi:MAG: metallophosphoesterase [Ignavibacteriaceae bacterium]